MAVAGDAGVVVLVPAANDLVDPWRLRHDPSGALGMPAHITLVYPFLRGERLEGSVLDRLRAVLAPRAPVELELRRTARFPETVYLAPEDPEPFRQMTAALVAEWPEAQPYGGQYADVVPHLTIADRATTELMDEIDRAVTPGLPISTTVSSAHVFVFDGDRWQARHELPFEGSGL